MSNLQGKVAVVTGASKGIGSGIAKSLAAAGAKVVVNYASDKAGADSTVAAIEKAGGEAIAVKASVSKSKEVGALFAEAKKAFGGVDILVNNAGVYTFGPLAEFDEDEYRRQFDTNVLGIYLNTREAAKQFGDKGGSVINVGSIASRMNMAGTSIYSATKAAVDSITESLSRELGPAKVRVNTVNPGPVLTPGTADLQGEMLDGLVKQTPLGRIGTPEDVAGAVVFLASDDARWVTGQIIRTSGGLQ